MGTRKRPFQRFVVRLNGIIHAKCSALDLAPGEFFINLAIGLIWSRQEHCNIKKKLLKYSSFAMLLISAVQQSDSRYTYSFSYSFLL